MLVGDVAVIAVTIAAGLTRARLKTGVDCQLALSFDPSKIQFPVVPAEVTT